MRIVTLTSLGLLLAAGSLSAQDFRWHGSLAGGKTLEVRGISGRIRATRAGGSEAEVTATKRARRSDPDDVEIKVTEDGEGVLICAVYPTRRGSSSCERDRGHGDNIRDNDVEVNFEVRVPAGVEFVGTTVNGDVSALDLPARARVSTVNGDVEVSTSGLAEATTVNGSVTATIGKADWTGDLDFTTVNGGITLTLPADLDADIRASTVNGSVDSDFPITIQGRMSPRSLRGRIGKGGRDLELTTVNGSIRLRKS